MPYVYPVLAAIGEAIGSVGTALGTTAFTVGGYAVTYGTLATLAIAAGGAVYSAEQTKKLKASLKGRGTTLSIRDPASTRKIVYGKQCVGGTIVFMNLRGTDHEFADIIIAHCAGEVDGFESLVVGSDTFTPNGDGVWVVWNGYLYAKPHRGQPGQSAEDELVTDSAGVWTSSDKLSGIAYTYVRLRWNPDVFPQGLPAISVVLRGRKVYDPRNSSTAYSTNPALCIRDYLTDATYGLGCSSAEIDDATVIAAANICDETVALKAGGTEKRYSLNGVVDTADTPKSIIEDMLTSMAGTLIFAGGKWRMYAGADRPVAATFSLDQVRGPLAIQTVDSLRDTCNAVKGIYISPDTQWQPADFPPVVNATYLADDSGERIWRDIELPFTTSAATAQRLAKIELERSRQQITLTLPLNLAGLAVTVGDIIALPFSRYGWDADDGKLFEVIAWKLATDDSPNGPVIGVDLGLREYAPGVWDWNSGNETTVDLAPNTTLPDPYTVAAPTAMSVTSGTDDLILTADGTIVPRIHVAWTGPAEAFVLGGGQIVVEYKKSSDTDWLELVTLTGSATECYITSVKEGVDYDVRAKAISVMGVSSDYVAVTGHTVVGKTAPPDAPTGLTASAGTGKAIALKWDANAELDFDEYRIYRYTSNAPGSATLIAEVRATAFVDAALALDATYYYWVSALDTSGNESGKSTVASATTTSLGANAIIGVLSNETQALPATAAGAVTSFAAAVSTMSVYNGTSDDTDAWSFAKTDHNCTSSLSGSTVTVSALSADSGYVEITASRTGFGSITKRFVLSKAKAGAAGLPGDPGAPGDDGANATAYWLIGSVAAISKSGAGAYTPSSLTISARSQTGAGAPAAYAGRFIIADTTNGSTYTDRYTSSANESSKSYTPGAGIVALRCRLYLAGGTSTLLDEQVIPIVADGTTVDEAVPDNPSAATLNSSGANAVSGDGTIYSWLKINLPASIPAGAKYINLLYRRHGTGEGWIVSYQQRSGAETAVIDDLSSGVSYDVACEAVSHDGISSSIVAATGSPFTAPNKTTPPGGLSSIAAHSPSSSYPLPPQYYDGPPKLRMMGCTVTFTPPSDLDYAGAEWSVSSIVGGNPAPTGSGDPIPAGETKFYYYAFIPGAGVELWTRTRDRTGNWSAWVDSGINLTGYIAYSVGSISVQDTDGVEVTGLKVGGSGARQVRARYPFQVIASYSAASEPVINVPIAGLSTKPDGVTGLNVSSDVTTKARYDWDDAANTSTNGVIKLSHFDGTAMVGGAARIHGEFFEYF